MVSVVHFSKIPIISSFLWIFGFRYFSFLLRVDCGEFLSQLIWIQYFIFRSAFLAAIVVVVVFLSSYRSVCATFLFLLLLLLLSFVNVSQSSIARHRIAIKERRKKKEEKYSWVSVQEKNVQNSGREREIKWHTKMKDSKTKCEQNTKNFKKRKAN